VRHGLLNGPRLHIPCWGITLKSLDIDLLPPRPVSPTKETCDTGPTEPAQGYSLRVGGRGTAKLQGRDRESTTKQSKSLEPPHPGRRDVFHASYLPHSTPGRQERRPQRKPSLPRLHGATTLRLSAADVPIMSLTSLVHASATAPPTPPAIRYSSTTCCPPKRSRNSPRRPLQIPRHLRKATTLPHSTDVAPTPLSSYSCSLPACPAWPTLLLRPPRTRSTPSCPQPSRRSSLLLPFF